MNEPKRIKRNLSGDKAEMWKELWEKTVPEEVLRNLETMHALNGGELAFAYEDMKREWTFDWCLPQCRVAVEIDGAKWITRRRKDGIMVPVGHNREKDYEKLNAAAELGWIVFRYTPNQLQRKGEECVWQVLRAVRRGMGTQ